MTEILIEKVYQGAIGFDIILNIERIPEIGATFTINVTKPDGTQVTWTATPYIVGSEYIHYVTQSGDLDDYGNYILQPHYSYGGKFLLGNSTIMTVYRLGE